MSDARHSGGIAKAEGRQKGSRREAERKQSIVFSMKGIVDISFVSIICKKLFYER